MAEATEEDSLELSTQSKMRLQTRGRVRHARRVSTGVKRKLKECTTPSISSPSSNDASSSSDESTTLCGTCNQSEPDPVALRRIRRKIESQWVCCDVCLHWVHCNVLMLTTRLYLLALSLVTSVLYFIYIFQERFELKHFSI